MMTTAARRPSAILANAAAEITRTSAAASVAVATIPNTPNPDAPEAPKAPAALTGTERADALDKLADAAADTEENEVTLVTLAKQLGDTDDTAEYYYAGRIGQAFAPKGTTKEDRRKIGRAVLKLAGNGAKDDTAAARVTTLAKPENEGHRNALALLTTGQNGGRKTDAQEDVYSNARACWSKVLYRAGLRIKTTKAPNTNAAGLTVMTDAQVAQADKETEAEKASATADKVALTTTKDGAKFLSTKAAELAVKIEKHPTAFTTGMRKAVLAFMAAMNAETALIDAAQ